MGLWVLAAACAGQLGLFSTGLGTTSRAVATLTGVLVDIMCHARLVGWITVPALLIVSAGQHSSPAHFLCGLLSSGVDGVPVRAILLATAVVSLLMLLDFQALVEANMTLCCIKLVFQYAAFIKTRAGGKPPTTVCKHSPACLIRSSFMTPALYAL